MPYALSQVKFATTFTIVLKSCDETPAVSVAVASTPNYEPDPSERYFVDYRDLQSLFKTTTFKVNTNSDQTLQGVNAEFNDQTVQTVGALLQTTAQFGGLKSLLNTPVGQLTTGAPAYELWDFVARAPTKVEPPPGICTPEAAKALANLHAAQEKLKKLIADSSGGAAPAAKPPTPAAAAPADASGADTAKNSAIAQATADVATYTNAVTMLVPITIRPTMADLHPHSANVDIASYPVDILRFVSDKWFESAPGHVSYNKGAPVDGTTRFYVTYEVASWSDSCVAPSGSEKCGQQTKATTIHGMVVRQPARADLRVCIDKCADRLAYDVLPVDAKGVPFDVTPPASVVIPQFGKKLELPLHSHVGLDATLNVALGPDGSINTLSFGSTTNLAAGLSALGGAATAASTAISNENAAIAAHNTAATAQMSMAVSAAQYPDAVLKAQADCLASQAAIIKAGQTPSVKCN